MLKRLLKKIQLYRDVVIPPSINNNLGFSERIKNRHRIFWTPLDAKKVINISMTANDAIEEWRNVRNWQRKLSNKRNSREFAKMHNCKLPDLYWRGRDLDEIKFNTLPKSFVVRPTQGYSSHSVFLMNDSLNLMDGKTYSEEDVKNVLATALKKNKNLEFLFEEFLRTEDGLYRIPDDYKFYTFNGEIACIQVINRLGPSKGFTTCYNEKWELIENVNIYYEKGEPQKPPECLLEMLQRVKELSEAYEIFVRIDFYATNKGAVFGEFTATPFRGLYFTLDADKLFIDYWDKFCKGRV